MPHARNSGSLPFKRLGIDPPWGVASVNAFDLALYTNLQCAFKIDLDKLWNLTPCLVSVASEVPRGVDDDVCAVGRKKVSDVDKNSVHGVALFQ